VSHSSKIKLPTFRTVVVLDLFSLWFSFCFPFTLFLYYVLRLVCLFRSLFLYQWGLIPRMGKTHRSERRISFVLRVISFCLCLLVWFLRFDMSAIYVLEFIYIATLAE
jgi:hypothetical protein